MGEKLSVAERQALCFGCENEHCIFSQECECRLPLVTGSLPVIDKGICLAAAASHDWDVCRSQYRVDESIPERVVFLWRSMAKMLASAPKGSEIWGVNTTHIRLRTDAALNAVGAAFGDLAGVDLFDEGYIHPIALREADVDISRLREPDDGDPNNLWKGLNALGTFNFLRCKEKKTEPRIFSDGKKIFVKEEAAAEGFVDIFRTLGLTVQKERYTSKSGPQNKEVCESGCWYVVYRTLMIDVYRDGTGLYAEHEIVDDNMVTLEFPEEIVRAWYAEHRDDFDAETIKELKCEPEQATFETWLNQVYTCDDFDGFCDFAREHGFNPVRPD